MFASHGYEVSTRAYLFHYYPKDKYTPSLDVGFEGKPDLVQIDLDAIAKKLEQIVGLLNGSFPGHREACDDCSGSRH